MKPGTVVEYATADGHQLGGVVDVVGKTKLIVITTCGDENRPPREDVTFTFAGNFQRGDRQGAIDAAKNVERRVIGIERTLDLAEVWAVASTGSSYDLAELARACGDGSGMAQLALARRLRDDDVYFRQRKGRIEARTVDQVEERLRQVAAEAEQASRRAAFVRMIGEVLALPATQRAARYHAEIAGDDIFAEWATILHEFAADEATYPRREEAEMLLDDLAQRRGPLAAPRGFELMRQLGVWSDHELLAVHRFGLALQHHDAMDQLAERAARAGFDREGREDFTGWWSLTLDDVDSTDIDDGLSIRPTLDGGWEVAVHIADPDAFVAAGSELDLEAQRRSTSMYLPDRAIGMFPDPLGAHAMSLHPQQQKPALTTHVQFDADLDIVAWRICRSVVEMNRRLSYEEADDMLQSHATDHATSVLLDLAFIADELHARRLHHGARSIDLPEPRVRVNLDRDEPQIDVAIAEPSPSRSLVAEFMVLVGELTARWCLERDVPVVYRGQQAPHTERDDAVIQEVPAGWPREFAVLMTMQRAQVTTTPEPHAGLGIELYTQATSPIRRYLDLVAQRQICAAMRGEPLPYTVADLQRIAHIAERAHHEVGQAEAEATTYWLLEAMRRREGEVVDAMVVATRGGSARRAEVILFESGYRTQVRLRAPAELGATLQLRIERAQPRPPILRLEQL